MGRDLQLKKLIVLILGMAGVFTGAAAWGASTDGGAADGPATSAATDTQPDSQQSAASGVLSDIGAYYTAPLR